MEADLGAELLVRAGIVAGAIDPAMQLETFPFAHNLLALILPRRHPLAGKRKVAFAETLGRDYVGANLTDPWAIRQLTLCVQRSQSASRHARRLLARLRQHGPSLRRTIAP